jgi:hypothetical protein
MSHPVWPKFSSVRAVQRRRADRWPDADAFENASVISRAEIDARVQLVVLVLEVSRSAGSSGTLGISRAFAVSADGANPIWHNALYRMSGGSPGWRDDFPKMYP